MGEQLRLPEHPSEAQIQSYIRETLPRQMTFLAAMTVAMSVEEQDSQIKALNLAIDAGETTVSAHLLAKAYQWRGTTLTSVTNYQNHSNFMDDFNKAIDLNPKYYDAYLNRSLAWLRLNSYDKALSDCSKAIELAAKDDDKAIPYVNCGSAYAGLGKYREAITYYDQALNMDNSSFIMDNSAELYFNRGRVYLLIDDYHRATSDFNKAIELGFNNVDVFDKRATAYAHQGQYEQALKDSNYIINMLDPEYSHAYFVRGQVFFKINKNDEAIPDLEKFLQFSSKDDPNRKTAEEMIQAARKQN